MTHQYITCTCSNGSGLQIEGQQLLATRVRLMFGSMTLVGRQFQPATGLHCNSLRTHSKGI